MSAAADKTSVTVRIAGEDHTIRANAQPEYTKRCAKLVDDRIHEIKMQSGLVDPHKAAILAALSIVDEYFQAQEELDRVRSEVAARASALAERLEARVAEGDEDEEG